MNADEIRKLADEYESLARVAHAAKVFMEHIAGYRIIGPDGQPRDVFHADMPEAIALDAALKAWRTISHAQE